MVVASEAEDLRLAIVEDHVLQRRRTEELFAGQPGYRVVYSCETLPPFISWLRHSSSSSIRSY